MEKRYEGLLQEPSVIQLDFSKPSVRRWIVEHYGLMGWCLVYLSHYFTATPADFHHGLARALESDDPVYELLLILGFRGSAKSTFATLALPLYFALEHIYDFIVLGGDTTTQTQLNIANIRYELENNPYLAQDYGTMFTPDKTWSTNKLQLLNGVLILGRSRGQKMRGLRHRQFRPQVIIIDDPEDVMWVKKKENRDKTEQWFNSEVLPAQQEDKSKLIVIGNLLHRDALMMRLRKKKRADGTPLFTFLKLALINRLGQITWKGKYPTPESLQKQKEKIGSPTVWSREYLLKIVSDADQIIQETDIHRYKNGLLDERDDEGKKIHNVLDAGVGGDLAISEKQSADCTAFVGGIKIMLDKQHKILIMPNPVNERMGYDATLTRAIKMNAVMPLGTKWYVEDVGYQKAALEGMRKKGLSTYPMRPINDKRARLETISPFIKDGTVLFPEYGCEALITQLLGFGIEEHDDLVDALVYLIMGLIRRRSITSVEKPDKI